MKHPDFDAAVLPVRRVRPEAVLPVRDTPGSAG